MNESHHSPGDQRIVEAMAYFGSEFEASDDGWREVMEGRLVPGEAAPSRRPRTLISGIAAAMLVVGLMAAAFFLRTGGEADAEGKAVAATDQTSSSSATAPVAPTSSTVPDVREMDIPEGKVPVAKHEGGIAGFVDAEAEASPEGYPTLDLPSEAPVRGLEVTDAEGALVGYFIEILGFVERSVAEEPGGVDRLIAEWEAFVDTPERQEERDAFMEEEGVPDNPPPPG